MKYNIDDIIRIPISRGFRLWKVTGISLGETAAEGHYIMRPLDLKLGLNVDGIKVESVVPCDLVDTHQAIERV